MSEVFEKACAELNDEQRLAVTTLDGPVLVVAGPGTGKTQLLSLRVANILKSRDVSPHNILCLTFTNAGADAMRERLTRFIGRESYEVRIETFHSFAQSLRSEHAEYFKRGVFDKPITSLETAKVVNDLLTALPVTNALYQTPYEGVAGNLGSVISLIGKIRKSGLSPDDLTAMCSQNEAFFDYFETELAPLLEKMGSNLQKMGKAERTEFCAELKAELLVALDAMPADLLKRYPAPLGSYEPYALLFKRAVQETEFCTDTGAATGFRTQIRERFFRGPELRFKDRRVNETLCAALDVYQQYRNYLEQQALYDFDDMIIDVNDALARHPEFAALLQEQYRYILIDEFQDTNGAQMRIVESIIEGLEAPNILAVGDDDQAIMRFQGASVEFINQFEQAYQGTRSIVLKKNYRSVPQIVDFGQQLARQIEGRLASSKETKHLVAVRDAAEELEFSPHLYSTKEAQYYAVAKEIHELVATGFMERSTKKGSEIAVIARKHGSLKALIPYLEHFGVEFNYRVRRNVSQIESLQTLFALMRCVAYWGEGNLKRAEAELPRIIAAPEYTLSPEVRLELARTARAERSWFTAIKSSEDSTVRALYERLHAAAAVAETLPIRQMLFELSDELTAFYQTRKDQEPYAILEFNYGLKALLSYAQEECETLSPKRRSERGLQGPFRLSYLVALLEQSERFGIEISVHVPVASKHAITLTTAHNSKGLEYDLVYLIDADHDNWKVRGGGARLLTQNLYLSETEDADDFRRLLFVAATRARNDLRISLAGTTLVPELVEITTPENIEISLEEAEKIAPLSWQEAYLPRGENLTRIARELLAERKLSVSLLNAFVEYRNNSLDGQSFFLRQLLSMPEPPSIHADFGTVVHDFFAAYLNEVVKAGTKTEAELVLEAYDELAALDYSEADQAHLTQRFELILERFLPTFKPRLEGAALAEQTLHAMLEDIPLTGRADLLIKDDASQTIAIYDYKTGKAKSLKDQGSGYLRQLQFYKLLIENTPQFKGYTATGGADIYVEPLLKEGLALAEEHFVSVSSTELEHLILLIKAVWYRLQEGLFDTSAFEQSEELAELRRVSVYKSKSGNNQVGDPKEPSSIDYQNTYEEWLIADWRRRVGEDER